jgi:hypothetical protein
MLNKVQCSHQLLAVQQIVGCFSVDSGQFLIHDLTKLVKEQKQALQLRQAA